MSVVWQVNTKRKEIALDKLAAHLKGVGKVSYNEYMLRFTINNYEIIVFPDARAIIRGTTDESLAKELYVKYIGT